MKLLCRIFGHKWHAIENDKFANAIINGICLRCHELTDCVEFEPDYQFPPKS